MDLDILEISSWFRQNPKSAITILYERLTKFKGVVYNKQINTFEGVKAVKDCIDFLKR